MITTLTVPIIPIIKDAIHVYVELLQESAQRLPRDYGFRFVDARYDSVGDNELILKLGVADDLTKTAMTPIQAEGFALLMLNQTWVYKGVLLRPDTSARAKNAILTKLEFREPSMLLGDCDAYGSRIMGVLW